MSESALEHTPLLADGCDVVTRAPRPALGARCQLRTWVTVEPSVCLFFAAGVSFFTTFQQFVYKRVSDIHGFHPAAAQNCTSSANTTEGQAEAEVQSQSSQFMFLLSLANLLPSLLPTLYLGHYSDLRGRKVAIVIPFVGACARQFLVLAMLYFDMNLFWFLLASSVESLCGGITTILMSAFAYVSDVSSRHSRAIRILVLEIAFVVTSSCNSVITGYLIEYAGFEYTFLYQFALYVIGLLFAVFYVEETITPQEGRFTLRCSHMTATFRLFVPFNQACRWDLILLLLLVLLPVTADVGGLSVTTFFFLGWPVCFTAISLGIFNAVTTVGQSLVAFLVLRLSQRWLPDTVYPMLGAAAAVAYFTMYGFSFNRTLIYIAPFVGSLKLLIVPLARALASKLIGPDDQGTLFAGIAFAEQLAMFVGSSVFNLIYYKTVSIYRGFVFFVAAGFQAATFALAVVVHCKTKHLKPKTEYVTIGDENCSD